MSTNGLQKLQTAVLEAGGHIEERAGYPDFRKFVVQYVFTREALERLIEAMKNEIA